MTLKMSRIDKTLPLPKYHTKGAVAFDLYARVEMTIKPREIKLIPTNLIVQAPAGFMLMIAGRSSLPLKKGLTLANGIGIIDQDYCGPDDEINLQAYNFTENVVKVARGERIGQAVLIKIAKTEFEEVDQIDAKSRGGFGSTG